MHSNMPTHHTLDYWPCTNVFSLLSFFQSLMHRVVWVTTSMYASTLAFTQSKQKTKFSTPSPEFSWGYGFGCQFLALTVIIWENIACYVSVVFYFVLITHEAHGRSVDKLIGVLEYGKCVVHHEKFVFFLLFFVGKKRKSYRIYALSIVYD